MSGLANFIDQSASGATVNTELTTADLNTGAGTDTQGVVGILGSSATGAQAIPGSTTDGLLVNLGTNNDVTVTGSVTANAGTNLNTSSLATEATLGDVKTSVQLIDNAVSGAGFNVSQLGGAAVPIGAGTEAAAVRVTLATDSTGVVSVDDNAGSLTVDYATTGSGNATGALRVELANNGTGVLATVGAVTAITNALPAGTNAIGKLAANSGVDIGDVDITSVVPGTAATNLGKAEDAGHTSGDVGVMALAVRNDALAGLAGTTLDYSPIAVDIGGRVMADKSPAAAMVRGLNSVAGTGDTAVTGTISGDAGLKTYITSAQVANTGSTTTLITFKDGNAGSALAYTIAPAGGGSNIVFETPLVTTANTALYFACASSSTTVYCSAQGYKAP